MVPARSASFCLVALACHAACLHIRAAPDLRGESAHVVGDSMKTVQDTVDEADRAVGGEEVRNAAGGTIGDAGAAVGGTASHIGAEPQAIQHVPVVGSGFKASAMSTMLWCVINLTIQYLLVYTALAVARVAAEAWPESHDILNLEEILRQGSFTVTYAPMLACLFLACQMRVNWLTKGKGDLPTGVKAWMVIATYAVLAVTLVAVVVPLFTGDIVLVDPSTGDMVDELQPFSNQVLAGAFTVLRYLIMAGLYVGIICIICGTVSYDPPESRWPSGSVPPPAPAVECTMILTCTYFLVYASIQISRTLNSFVPSLTYISKVNGALHGALYSMALAPMLSILFIAARMRALQMDPNGQPQAFAQGCFYACTYAMVIQSLLALVVPLVLGGEVTKVHKAPGEVVFSMPNGRTGTVCSVVGCTVMFIIYSCVSVLFWSIFTIQHPSGPQFTPPISGTMQCVINLVVQYFVVYQLIRLAVWLDEWFGMDWHYIRITMESAKATVAFCPVLAILFLGTRMRALRLTNNMGAVQGWCLDGMFMASWAILLQVILILLVPAATWLTEGRARYAETDHDGNLKKWPSAGRGTFLLLCSIRWLLLLLLYGGIIAVIVGAITMTPETANGRSGLPLVHGTPLGAEPPGWNDLPGMPSQGDAAPQDVVVSP